MKDALKSGQRINPKQTRAQDRINSILDTTEHLLATGQAVNTSSIAAYAGIPVGSVYRYFPNILGVYRCLFEKLNHKLHLSIEKIISEDGHEKNWVELFEEILAKAIELYQQHPAFGNLLLNMSHPALQEVKKDCIRKTSHIFATRWHAGYDGFHDGNIEDVALAVSNLFTVIEHCYFEQVNDDNNSALFWEMVKALKSYLSLYLISPDSLA